MSFLTTYRLIIFVLCTILAIPVLGLMADLTHLTTQADLDVESWQSMSLFISALSLLVLPTLLIVSATRKNAFILYNISEMGIIGLLWIFWVAAAGLTIREKKKLLMGFSCKVLSGFSTAEQKCNELVSIQGIEIVIFVLLLKYLLVLFIYSIIIHLRDGNSQVWYQTVADIQGPSLPALTHKTGDLELNTNAPMNTYATPASAPVTYNTTAAQ